MNDRVVCPVCGGTCEADLWGDAGRPRMHKRSCDRDRTSAGDDQHPSDGIHTVTDDTEPVAALEEESGRSGLEAAESRDRAAELRDRGAEGRDLQARMREVLHDDRAGAENILLRAGRDRARAADDRAKAAADRARAAAEREQAAHDRATALRAQADARHNLLLAASDELTGALTRPFGLAGVAHEIDRAGRSGGKLVLATIEVDRLNEVNRTLGRTEADLLLRFIGDSLRANTRTYDLIVRYDEDEFLCAMPSTTRAVATKRLAMIASVLTATDKQRAITFGLTEYQSPDKLQNLLDRANKDLLAARHASGRD